MTTDKVHQRFMEQALSLARFSASIGEVPVGAVVVIDGLVVGKGFNRRELNHCVLEHAEINAIKDACKRLGRWRLCGATIYSTLEPCIMCAGAMSHARIDNIIYGACDKKFGAIESLYNIADDSRLNHRFGHQGGVLADKSSDLLKEFFTNLRSY